MIGVEESVGEMSTDYRTVALSRCLFPPFIQFDLYSQRLVEV